MRADKTKLYKSIYIKSTVSLEKIFAMRGEKSKAAFYEEIARDGLLYRLMKLMEKSADMELLQLMSLDQLIEFYIYKSNSVQSKLKKILDDLKK
jgi:hypothetical protein